MVIYVHRRETKGSWKLISLRFMPGKWLTWNFTACLASFYGWMEKKTLMKDVLIGERRFLKNGKSFLVLEVVSSLSFQVGEWKMHFYGDFRRAHGFPVILPAVRDLSSRDWIIACRSKAVHPFEEKCDTWDRSLELFVIKHIVLLFLRL